MLKSCAWLQNRVSIETDGWTRPCCLEISPHAKIAKISNGIENAFNDQKLITLNYNLANTGFSNKTDFACNRCRQLEENGQASLRTTTKYLSTKREIKSIQFKLSNRCQLTCLHCSPTLSSGWAKIMKITPIVQESFIITDKFIEELIYLLPNLTEIKFTGGEPFLDPNHWKILEHLKNYNRSHCELIYITNGLIKPKYNLWEGWKSITCNVSIDGYDDTYHWFRRGSNWEELLKNVLDLKNYSNVNILYSITPWTIQDHTKIKNLFTNTAVFFTPIVKPDYASLLEFPKTISTKYWPNSSFTQMGSGADNLEKYRNFANYWDSTWNTNGWAYKLYPWLND